MTFLRRRSRWARSAAAWKSRDRRSADRDLPSWPRKEDAACCVSRRDELGRLPVGFCSAECVRRPGRRTA